MRGCFAAARSPRRDQLISTSSPGDVGVVELEHLQELGFHNIVNLGSAVFIGAESTTATAAHLLTEDPALSLIGVFPA